MGVEIFEDAENHIIASGLKDQNIFNETTWIMKLDINGNLISQKEFNFAPYQCTEGRFSVWRKRPLVPAISKRPLTKYNNPTK